ncbi:MmgE/PrpD family protein [Amycolatopsis acidicola]|uniref:MmgE/PrpD family protein n=1 Tax=Amycolatopsis acidicola TaxID=2596893 RepID=A0A5N0UZB6_9PSEU|nr:MmgE/PrpD family protein [Amycolatopsis acidicola]KAA9159365.1 MmgE/PrpD family protein [Amycolatopsis acidicola]
MTATTELASFVAAHADFPPLVTSRLRDLFLDYLGNSAFAAAEAENGPAVRAAIRSLDPGEGPGTVIGESRGYAWPYAALLNGCYAHSLDFDDTNRLQVGHPGAPVISAALADAERLGVKGNAFLDALAIGYEVSCRVGAAVGPTSYDRGFHLTSTSGIFGAVAAVARLRGFDAETVENAFGLALSKAAGSMQYLANGAWNKRLHPGFAAHDAIVAATLAESGVRGASAAFEGQYGLLNGYSADPHPEALTDGLGEEWLLLETGIKPYPSCRFTHAPIDATLALRERISPAEREKAALEVELSPTAMKIVGEPLPAKLDPRGSVDSQFSVFSQVALAWLDGTVGWSSYGRLPDEDVRRMTTRVTTRSADLGAHGTTVTVRIDGRTLSETVTAPLGEPENWVGDKALREKFTGLAVPVYGEQRAEEIVAAVSALGADTDLRALAGLLRR